MGSNYGLILALTRNGEYRCQKANCNHYFGKIVFHFLNERNSGIKQGEENYSWKVEAIGLLARRSAVPGLGPQNFREAQINLAHFKNELIKLWHKVYFKINGFNKCLKYL